MKNGELKQETREAEEKEAAAAAEYNVSLWDCGSPLYDSFELASLCHQLDRHLMLLPFTKGSGRLTLRLRDEHGELDGETIMVVSPGRLTGKKEEIDKKKSKVVLRDIFRAIAFWRKL